jgi:hypothetical protein
MGRMTSMRPDRISAARVGVVLALFSANLGCWDECDADGKDWCEGDTVMTCHDEADHNDKVEDDHCMPGGCYKDSKSKYGAYCRVPLYTCPAGVTGYRCLEDRRIYCEANGVARDHDDCSTWPNDPSAPELHCVEDPAGGLPGCGYTTERCTTPGDVMCLGNGTVECGQDFLWQSFVPSTAAGQSVCDASKIRYRYCVNRDPTGPTADATDDTWCEGDQIVRCDKCVEYSGQPNNSIRLCVSFTAIASCQPGTCTSSSNDVWVTPMRITGCQEPAPECTAEGQFICRGERPGYCSAPAVVALDRPCSEIWSLSRACEIDPQSDYVHCKWTEPETSRLKSAASRP